MANREGLAWGEGTIEARGDRFQARWLETGDDGAIRRRARTFDTRDLAEDHLRRMRRDKRDGRYVPPSERTVADLIADWLARGERRWKPATQAAYRQRAASHVLPALGGLRAETLTTPRVQHWIDRLARSGLDASTIDAAARVLGGALREAVRIGVLPRDPSAGIRLPAVTQKPIVTWSAEQVAAALTALAGEPMWSALYRLALTTGVRPGELRALVWRDVDMTHGVLNVRRTMTKDADGRVALGESTKTGRRRAVALPASTVAALTAWRTRQKARQLAAADWPAEPFIFDRGDGRFLPLTTWQHRHDRLCREAGLPHLTLHGLRHTYATLMLENNAHPKIVADALGHVDVGTTLNVYSHASDAIQRAAADALDKRLFGDIDATTSDATEAT